MSVINSGAQIHCIQVSHLFHARRASVLSVSDDSGRRTSGFELGSDDARGMDSLLGVSFVVFSIISPSTTGSVIVRQRTGKMATIETTLSSQGFDLKSRIVGNSVIKRNCGSGRIDDGHH